MKKDMVRVEKLLIIMFMDHFKKYDYKLSIFNGNKITNM